TEGARIEFWDLRNHFDVKPQSFFDGIDGFIDGEKFLTRESVSEYTLIVSTRSHHAYALRLLLPAPDASGVTLDVSRIQQWDGYSELHDATEVLWAFGRTCSAQTAMLVQTQSGQAVALEGTETDPLLCVARAMQVTVHCVAIARRSSLDIYDMTTIAAALGHSAASSIIPSCSLTYPNNWIGSGLTFIPVRPPWVRPNSPTENTIHLVLAEDATGTSVGLIARQEHSVCQAPIPYTFDDPYKLSGEDIWTVAMSWGDSARRMMRLDNAPGGTYLTGISIGPGLGAPDVHEPRITKSIFRCQVPGGADDFAYQITFEESTGMSAIAMASGRIWIMDTCGLSVDMKGEWGPTGGTLSLHPDPIWSKVHPTPWFDAAKATEATFAAWVDNPDAEETEFDPPIDWSSSVEEYFPGKNDEDSFGGATWFVNEVLHLQGKAKVILFTLPRWDPFPTLELIQLGDRFLTIERREDAGKHEAYALERGATAQDLEMYLRAGGLPSRLPG
ncbi:hypothetical protein FRB90_009138, partial [Tulasnella sp. 427]